MDSFFPVVRFLFPIYVFTVFFWKGRWVGFPVSVSKRNFQSMRNNSPKKNNYPSPSLQSSLFLVSFTVHLLRNVGVHFTVLWCPRQVFSFYKSLYPLFDYHRARKKTCPELLSDLNKHTKKKKEEQKVTALKLLFIIWKMKMDSVKWTSSLPLQPGHCVASSSSTSWFGQWLPQSRASCRHPLSAESLSFQGLIHLV